LSTPDEFVPHVVVSVFDEHGTLHHAPMHVAGAVHWESIVHGSPTCGTRPASDVLLPAHVKATPFGILVHVVLAYPTQSLSLAHPGAHDFPTPVAFGTQ
jgi:hypothetical protein